MIGMLVTRKFGEEVWIDFFEWGAGESEGI